MNALSIASKSAGIIAAMLRGGPLECDAPKMIEDFSPEKFMGAWHKVSHNGGILNPTFVNCEAIELAEFDEASSRAKLWTSNQGMGTFRIGAEGFIRFDEGGSIHVGNGDSETADPRRVIMTDYETYAVFYSCSPEDYEENVEVFTRDSKFVTKFPEEWKQLKKDISEVIPEYHWKYAKQNIQPKYCDYEAHYTENKSHNFTQ